MRARRAGAEPPQAPMRPLAALSGPGGVRPLERRTDGAAPGGAGEPEVRALRQRAAHLAQQLGLALVVDALRDQLEPQRGAHVDHGAHDRGLRRPGASLATNERSILTMSDREVR